MIYDSQRMAEPNSKLAMRRLTVDLANVCPRRRAARQAAKG